jgi:hypothetical protein
LSGGAALLAFGGLAAGGPARHLVDRGPADQPLGDLGVAFIVTGQSAMGGQSGRWVGRAARCQRELVFFRAASRRTGLDGFPIIRLSSDYRVSGSAGFPVWMSSWQVGQTTSVLRRRFAMSAFRV